MLVTGVRKLMAGVGNEQALLLQGAVERADHGVERPRQRPQLIGRFHRTRRLRSPPAIASAVRSSVCTGCTSRRANPTANPDATSSASAPSAARLNRSARVPAITSRIGRDIWTRPRTRSPRWMGVAT